MRIIVIKLFSGKDARLYQTLVKIS